MSCFKISTTTASPNCLLLGKLSEETLNRPKYSGSGLFIKPLGTKNNTCTVLIYNVPVKVLHRNPVLKGNPAELSVFHLVGQKTWLDYGPRALSFHIPVLDGWGQKPFSQTFFVLLVMKWPQARLCFCFVFVFSFRHTRGTSAVAGGLQCSNTSPVPSSALHPVQQSQTYLGLLPASCLTDDNGTNLWPQTCRQYLKRCKKKH